MRTSADARLADGRPVLLRAVPYDDPLARELVDRVQQEYVTRYGGPDEAVVDPAEFEPPTGLFLVAEVDGVPAGCGGWRVHAPGVAEVKRVYVARSSAGRVWRSCSWPRSRTARPRPVPARWC